MLKSNFFKLIRLCLLTTLLHCLILLLSISPIFAAIQKKDVLILNSYHKGYKWTDDITRGIESVLGPYKDSISLYIEYMDSKRNADDGYFKHLLEMYQYKFKNQKFDVIISSDDNAFNFLKKYRDRLFPQTPVVFCGVNYFKQDDLKGHEFFTGVNEEADLKSGIDLALKLHPDTERIVVINDQTTTGKKIHDRLIAVIPEYRERIGFSLLEEVSMEEIQEKMKVFPSNTLVFYSFFFRDKNGQFFEYDESISLISEKSKVPIYGAWDFSLGYGIVGGMLTSGFFQGETAAGLALRILNGEHVSDVPIVLRSPNRYMFDYQQLVRFDINQSVLPIGSIIINKPPSFYDEYRTLSWFIIVCMTSLVLMVLILSINIFHRQKAEKKIKEAHD